MADITPRIRIVVAETVIIQSRLNVLILTLILKRNEGGIIVVLPALSTEAVEFLLPYLVALLCRRLAGVCRELSLPTNSSNATKALYCHYQQLVATVQTSRSVT